MEIAADLMIVSEAWEEDGVVHLVAWLPDIDPEKRSLKLKRKRITYDPLAGRIIEIRDAQA